ncbi:hypothetical protein AMTRI_Chr06g200870 [Amborella trichopoda]
MAQLEPFPRTISSTYLAYEDRVPADLFAVSELSTSSCNQRINSNSNVNNSNNANTNIPKPPPLPSSLGYSKTPDPSHRRSGYSWVPKETKNTWERLFEEGYRADVHILTDDKAVIPSHSNILGVASPVFRNILNQMRAKDRIPCIRIPGVPSEAVRTFVRFLYSSCYEKEAMKRFVLHLLVLSHTFSVPSLKRVCSEHLEHGLLTMENVIDALQLARMCDASRLELLCIRFIVNNFKSISTSEGWKVMRKTDPQLEQELLEYVVEADSRKQEKTKRIEERKIYLQLYDAMEALMHICKDGCRNIGPHDKVLKGGEGACNFPACKGLELLVRHFSSCKVRVPGGCTHCKRMWQLLELHSRMCGEPDVCKVPLCKHFKEKMKQQSKKDEVKWNLLVSKVMAAKATVNSLSKFKASGPYGININTW